MHALVTTNNPLRLVSTKLLSYVSPKAFVGWQSPMQLREIPEPTLPAEDWLVAIDSNRYSVPFMLIGKTVQVVRQGGSWVIRHRGAVVAEHAVLAGRGQLSVLPQHGPGAAVRNARQRYATPRKVSAALDLSREVEVRDLAVYEQLFGSQPAEVTA